MKILMQSRGAAILAAMLAAALFVACDNGTTSSDSDDDDDDSSISSTDAQAMTGEVLTAVSSAIASALSSGISGNARAAESPDGIPALSVPESSAAPARSTISYSGSGYSVSGTYTTTTTGFSYSMTITISSYTSGNVTLSSGAATIAYSGSSTSGTYSYRGSFRVLYKGVTYIYTWTINASYSSSSGYSYSGSYTVNGQSFTYTGSGSSDGDSTDTSSSTSGFCFWCSNSSTVGTQSIYINGTKVGSLTVHFTSGTPTWGQSGTLVVSRPAGTYTISASDDGGHTWGPSTATLSSSTSRVLYEFQ